MSSHIIPSASLQALHIHSYLSQPPSVVKKRASTLCKLICSQIHEPPQYCLQQLQKLLFITTTAENEDQETLVNESGILVQIYASIGEALVTCEQKEEAEKYFEMGFNAGVVWSSIQPSGIIENSLANARVSMISEPQQEDRPLAHETKRFMYFCGLYLLGLFAEKNQGYEMLSWGASVAREAKKDGLRLIEAMANGFMAEGHVYAHQRRSKEFTVYNMRALELFEVLDEPTVKLTPLEQYMSLMDQTFEHDIGYLKRNTYHQVFADYIVANEYWKAEKLYNKLQMMSFENTDSLKIDYFHLLGKKLLLRIGSEKDMGVYVKLQQEVIDMCMDPSAPQEYKDILSAITDTILIVGNTFMYGGKLVIDYIDFESLLEVLDEESKFMVTVEQYLRSKENGSTDAQHMYKLMMSEIRRKLPSFEAEDQCYQLAYCYYFLNDEAKTRAQLHKMLGSMFEVLETKFTIEQDPEEMLLASMGYLAQCIPPAQQLYMMLGSVKDAVRVMELGRSFSLYKKIEQIHDSDMPMYTEFELQRDVVPILAAEEATAVCYSLTSMSSKMTIFVIRPNGELEHYMTEAPLFELQQAINLLSTSGHRAIKKAVNPNSHQLATAATASKISLSTATTGIKTSSNNSLLEILQMELPIAWEDQQKLLKYLYRLLIHPIIDRMTPGTPLYILPINELNTLNWNMLCDAKTGRYLFQDYPISILPNLKFLTYAARRHTKIQKQISTTSSATPNWSMGLVGLGEDIPETLEEMKSLQQIATDCPQAVTCNSISGTASHKKAVVSMLQTVNCIHFATHGSAIQNPEKEENFYSAAGALFCAGKEPLFGIDIEAAITQSGSNIAFAFLNACEVAKGMTVSGDMSLSICRSLHTAGVPSIIASFVPLQDLVASKLASLFYYYLLRKRITSTEALRLAMIDMMEKLGFHPSQLLGYVHLGKSFALDMKHVVTHAGNCFIESVMRAVH